METKDIEMQKAEAHAANDHAVVGRRERPLAKGHGSDEKGAESTAPVTVAFNGTDVDVTDALKVIISELGGYAALNRKVDDLAIAENPTMLKKVVNELKKERVFIEIVIMGFVAGLSYPSPDVARWIGFMLAAYSAIANDSIQTLGTFIAANKDRKWYELWLFIVTVFICTSCYSWAEYDGDVSYERLISKGFETTPEEFKYLQVVAPVFLLILTRLRMPVSTTFLLLNCFVTSGKTLAKMVTKSLQGYALALVIALVVWGSVGPFLKRKIAETEATPVHRVIQWCTTGFLWSVWLMQDLANIAVFLPRSLSVGELCGFLAFITVGLAIMLVQGGEKIQKVVEEKSCVSDTRQAIVVNLIYGIILLLFKMKSRIPMSTTWVFVGLLTGRELSLTARGAGDEGRTLKQGAFLAARDLACVATGFLVSLILAININPVIGDKLFG